MYTVNLPFVFRHEMKINFHDSNDIKNVVFSYRVAPEKPSAMCTQSANSILYVDESKFPSELRWMDCRKQCPKPGSYVTHSEQNSIWDICSLHHKGKQLVVSTRGVNIVYAYNTVADKCEWTLKENLGKTEKVTAQSVTTDGFGHLYVTDFLKSAIKKISANGIPLETVIRTGRTRFG